MGFTKVGWCWSTLGPGSNDRQTGWFQGRLCTNSTKYWKGEGLSTINCPSRFLSSVEVVFLSNGCRNTLFMLMKIKHDRKTRGSLNITRKGNQLFPSLYSWLNLFNSVFFRKLSISTKLSFTYLVFLNYNTQSCLTDCILLLFIIITFM